MSNLLQGKKIDSLVQFYRSKFFCQINSEFKDFCKVISTCTSGTPGHLDGIFTRCLE